MRISTSMIFNNGTNGIQNLQSDWYKLQNQMSTGRRILSPADDPIGASEALLVSQSQGVNQQFLDNQATARSQLNYVETTLGSVTDNMLSIVELASDAGNTTYSAAQRSMVAEELKQRMSSLIGLANTRDGTGLYIFSGYQSTTEPFQINTAAAAGVAHSLGANTYVNYSGDAGKTELQVSASKTMATAESGLDAFVQVKDAQGVVTTKSLFDGVQNMVEILDGTRPYTTADYTQALKDINSSLNHVATVRASVGARLNALDSLTSAGEDVGVLYDTRLSELQDLDYTKAISDFSRVQMQLEAAQLTFKQTSQMSLFNIL
ncbi:flagellar hook-associated protein FlgL [Dechloromonas denitrificans]|uniref:flagellar hook-associated protein FlgL n=1 Tax=Dechloromonas denitrificans TaxID=281362 RepID=UPI001CF9AF64|nr:flagellar hook-associated protein FlgL [Dechloromonas denitrificans]UCV08877.1 flagellar hook-associated protein FlgL [Dechloromonas denitrificans]